MDLEFCVSIFLIKIGLLVRSLRLILAILTVVVAVPVSAVGILLVMLSVGGGSLRLMPRRGAIIIVGGTYDQWAVFLCHDWLKWVLSCII